MVKDIKEFLQIGDKEVKKLRKGTFHIKVERFSPPHFYKKQIKRMRRTIIRF